MATRQNLIDTYNANPTLQARYTLPQYLSLFNFSQTTTPTQTPTTTPTQTPATSGIPNIINQNLNQPGGEGDGGAPPPGPTDPYAGLGYSSENFGLGKDLVNKDAVFDYEADAAKVGKTTLGQLSKFGVGIFNALKNIPTPFNLMRKAYDFTRQKEIDRQRQEEAIAKDLAREIQQQNIANKTGGYQFGYSPSSDFMSGGSQGQDGFANTEAGIGAASAAMGSSKDGGIIGYGGKSGTPKYKQYFNDGGRVYLYNRLK